MCELCVCVLMWHLCETLQLSTLPGIRNQTQSHLTSCELRSVTKNMHVRAHTHTHTYTLARIHKPQRNRATGHTLFPRPAEKEGSKGWWSHSTPTVNLPVTHFKLPSPFTSSTLEVNRSWSEICGVIHFYSFLNQTWTSSIHRYEKHSEQLFKQTHCICDTLTLYVETSNRFSKSII